MFRQALETLLKSRVPIVIFLVTLLGLYSLEQPVKTLDAFKVSDNKVASPLAIAPPKPTATPAPTPTLTATPTIKPRPKPTSTPAPTATPTPDPKSPDNPEIWEKIAECETHGNWSSDTGNGYFGGLQFSQGAWNSVGGSGNPAHAPKDEQINRGKMLQAKRGWGVWGACAKQLGLN